MCTCVVAVTFRSEQKCLSTWCKRCARCLKALHIKHAYEGFELVNNNNSAGRVLTAPGGEEPTTATAHAHGIPGLGPGASA